MPTIFRYEGYRFYFYSNEHLPEHIHVENGDAYARVELDSLEVTDRYGANSKELKKIVKVVRDNRAKIKGAWHDYFSE
jgi:hypothetical protein